MLRREFCAHFEGNLPILRELCQLLLNFFYTLNIVDISFRELVAMVFCPVDTSVRAYGATDASALDDVEDDLLVSTVN